MGLGGSITIATRTHHLTSLYMVPVKVGEPDSLFDRTRALAKRTVVNIIHELINHHLEAPAIAFPARTSCHRTTLPIARWTNHLLTRRKVNIALSLAIPAPTTGRSDCSCSIAFSTWMPVGCSLSIDHYIVSLLSSRSGISVTGKGRGFHHDYIWSAGKLRIAVWNTFCPLTCLFGWLITPLALRLKI